MGRGNVAPPRLDRTTCGMFVLLLCASDAQALLIDQGNGLAYDTVNDISWPGTQTSWGSPVGQPGTPMQTIWCWQAMAAFVCRRSTRCTVSMTSCRAPSDRTREEAPWAPFVDIRFNDWSTTRYAPIPGRVLFMGFSDGVVRIGELGYTRAKPQAASMAPPTAHSPPAVGPRARPRRCHCQ